LAANWRTKYQSNAEVEVGSDDELDARLTDMREHFLVPPSTEDTFAEFDAATLSLRSEYQAVAKAFRHSLASALSTIAMPFVLASTGTDQRHFQRIYMAERIRARSIDEDALHPGEDLETVRERQAHTKADLRMGEFVQSEDGRNALIRDTCEFLLASLKRGLESAAHELLQQGLVLLWSAFEVLSRDTFETLLNGDPTKIQALISHPTTRKRFEAERLPLDTLVQHGFDLSGRLGTVLVGQQDFSDLRIVKAVYAVLCPGNDALNQALAHRDLWTLFQRRHLVVHRRGVIDQAYLDATGETHPIGMHLVVTPLAFEGALRVVVSAGTALARSLPLDRSA
jgi:hypothetical protein